MSAVMRGNRKRDTKPEIAIRSSLHRSGLRFRKDFPIRADSGRPIRADIVFPRARVAVFVDGCFWHRCPQHGTSPRSNSGYWRPKLDRNVERDREVDRRLTDAGWTVVRVWEHEDPEDAARQIGETLRPPAG
jgi:DNA mismatch endonuclease (patch repair protein)